MNDMLRLEPIKRTDPRLLANMRVHYSQPKGFVGRNICYAIMVGDQYFGGIVGGSTPKYMANRQVYLMMHRIEDVQLNQIVNNIFFHVNGPYPFRNFTTRVLREYRSRIEIDWFVKYGDCVRLHETLVELPRSGETYRRDGWLKIGQTKGFTCKRTAGVGTDSWTGKRVWDTENLRPKHVFIRRAGA